MVPSPFSSSRTGGEDTPMAGISTRTGGEGGRRRHDPTGKSMTWVVRVGAAAGLVVVGAATRLSTTTPRRTSKPLVMTWKRCLAARPPLLDDVAGGRDQTDTDQQEQREPPPARAGVGAGAAGAGGHPAGGGHRRGRVADVEQLELLADAADRDQRRDGAAGQLQVVRLGQDLAAAALADLDVDRARRDLLVVAGRGEPGVGDEHVAAGDQVHPRSRRGWPG